MTDPVTCELQIYAGRRQGLRRHALVLGEQSEKYVLRPNEWVSQETRRVLWASTMTRRARSVKRSNTVSACHADSRSFALRVGLPELRGLEPGASLARVRLGYKRISSRLWTRSGSRRRAREPSTPCRRSSRPRRSRWHAWCSRQDRSEEARRILESRRFGEGHLHDVLVGLACAGQRRRGHP